MDQAATMTGKADEKKITQEKDSTSRTCRRMLATAATIPPYLYEMFHVPEHISIAHTTNVDSTLPLFQARLCSGSYEGKMPGSNLTAYAILWLLYFLSKKIPENKPCSASIMRKNT